MELIPETVLNIINLNHEALLIIDSFNGSYIDIFWSEMYGAD